MAAHGFEFVLARLGHSLFVLVLAAAVGHRSHAAPPDAPPATETLAQSPKPAEMDMEGFLDRLMIAESGGRDDARNTRSTALGPYQFIESTWLELTRRLFAAETRDMTLVQTLALRADRAFARKVAHAYTLENAVALKAHGFEATFPRLRLAFLLGPQGALRVLVAPPATRAAALLGPKVANANPFMFGLTAEGLIARAAHDLAVSPQSLAGAAASAASADTTKARTAPRVTVKCNLALISCHRWQALAIARVNAGPPPRKKIAVRAR